MQASSSWPQWQLAERDFMDCSWILCKPCLHNGSSTANSSHSAPCGSCAQVRRASVPRGIRCVCCAIGGQRLRGAPHQHARSVRDRLRGGSGSGARPTHGLSGVRDRNRGGWRERLFTPTGPFPLSLGSRETRGQGLRSVVQRGGPGAESRRGEMSGALLRHATRLGRASGRTHRPPNGCQAKSDPAHRAGAAPRATSRARQLLRARAHTARAGTSGTSNPPGSPPAAPSPSRG